MQGKAALVVTLFLEWSGTLACRVAGSHAVRAEMRRSDKHMFREDCLVSCGLLLSLRVSDQ